MYFDLSSIYIEAILLVIKDPISILPFRNLHHIHNTWVRIEMSILLASPNQHNTNAPKLFLSLKHNGPSLCLKRGIGNIHNNLQSLPFLNTMIDHHSYCFFKGFQFSPVLDKTIWN